MKIYAISDTHGLMVGVPGDADLILHAGDLSQGFSPRKQQEEFFLNMLPAWAEHFPDTKFVCTGGNHDFVLQEFIWGERPLPTNYADNLEIVIGSQSQLAASLGLKVYCTPWNNVAGWAFSKPRLELAKSFGEIPSGLDVLVTHMPPAGLFTVRVWDEGKQQFVQEDPGSAPLRDQILEVRPKLVICGHIHTKRGAYELDGIPVLNVAAVNKDYELVNGFVDVSKFLEKVNDSEDRQVTS